MPHENIVPVHLGFDAYAVHLSLYVFVSIFLLLSCLHSPSVMLSFLFPSVFTEHLSVFFLESIVNLSKLLYY